MRAFILISRVYEILKCRSLSQRTWRRVRFYSRNQPRETSSFLIACGGSMLTQGLSKSRCKFLIFSLKSFHIDSIFIFLRK